MSDDWDVRTQPTEQVNGDWHYAVHATHRDGRVEERSFVGRDAGIEAGVFVREQYGYRMMVRA